MENIKSHEWSEEESSLLRHAKLMAKVDRLRAGPEKKEPRKSRWERFLNSTGGTALITVLITGVFGSLITGMVQRGLKDREFQQAWMTSRGNQALVIRKEYLEQERELVNNVYGLIGRCLAASDEVIDLTRPHFDPKNYPGVEPQKLAIRKNFNACDRQWREENEKLGLLMGYYHPGRPEVTAAWKEIQVSAAEYMRGVRAWYLAHNSDYTTAECDCDPKKKELIGRLDKLNETINTARQYAWEGWESPEKLRVVLEKND